jgi:CRISPR-associated protein Cst2
VTTQENQQEEQVIQASSSSGDQSKSYSVFEVAILARVTWDLHSLNNEGTIGNVTEPRTIVLWDGARTDGISGEMMKHIHAYWTWLQAIAEKKGLCNACQNFRPQRADADRQGLQGNNAGAMGIAINRCVLCDLHGFLVQRPTIHRQSVVEFGWVVGVPKKFNRDIHVHARHAVVERGSAAGDREQNQKASAEAGAEQSERPEGAAGDEEQEQGASAEAGAEQSERPEGAAGDEEQEQGASAEAGAEQSERPEGAAQMVYHRPTRSGVYALVTLFQPWRIGLNEVEYCYIDDAQRKERYNLALTAYEWTLKRPDGAMTTTRFPHIQGIEGIVLISGQPVPVPMLSPLQDDYREKLQKLAEKQGVEARKFKDFAELLCILSDLRKKTPFRMPFKRCDEMSASVEKTSQRRRSRKDGKGALSKVSAGAEEREQVEESEESLADSPADTE